MLLSGKFVLFSGIIFIPYFLIYYFARRTKKAIGHWSIECGWFFWASMNSYEREEGKKFLKLTCKLTDEDYLIFRKNQKKCVIYVFFLIFIWFFLINRIYEN
jgi:hypothetical protein